MEKPKLSNYLFTGTTVPHIVELYAKDLAVSESQIDIFHSSFLVNYMSLITNNEFLDRYVTIFRAMYLAIISKFPNVTIVFKGRIKSLRRVEEKINRYIIKYVNEYYILHDIFPNEDDVVKYLYRFRDLMAFRIIVSLPSCHLKKFNNVEDLEMFKQEREIDYLRQIVNFVYKFLTTNGLDAVIASQLVDVTSISTTKNINNKIAKYLKDYIQSPKPNGYRAIHICFSDRFFKSETGIPMFIEFQFQTKSMNDFTSFDSDHVSYEMNQKESIKIKSYSFAKEDLPEYILNAQERLNDLYCLNLEQLNIDLFSCRYINGVPKFNDYSGFYVPRSILSYEHISKEQH